MRYEYFCLFSDVASLLALSGGSQNKPPQSDRYGLMNGLG